MYEVYKELKKFGRVRTNFFLSKLSTFKVGGPAEALIEIASNEQLVELLNFVSGEGIDFFILGGGSNVLFPDDGLRGVVVKIESNQLEVVDDIVRADSGVVLGDVVTASIKASLGGFEWAVGIPGSVGGAVRGNAGAKYAFTGGEIKDSAVSVSVWRNGEVVEVPNAECLFGYRDSIFKHNNDVILGTIIKLGPGNQPESLGMTQKIIAERKGKQSSEPSAGSFFKNVFLTEWKRDPAELPERFRNYKKIASGWLIEEVGLKGYRVGDAMISNEHANFIVNKGGATQAHILAIVDEVQTRVYDRFGINLEPEVQIIK